MHGRTPTVATLRQVRKRIDELIDSLCPMVDFEHKMICWELDHLIDHLTTDAQEVARRRQGKFVLAAITGEATWEKDDEHGWWPGHEAADAEEDALDALEEMVAPEPQSYRDMMIEAARMIEERSPEEDE